MGPLDLHVEVVAVAREAHFIGEVLGPVDEVLAAAEIDGVDVGRVRHDRAKLARVPLAEEVVLLAQPLEEVHRQGPVGDPLPHEVLLGGHRGLERLERGHELVDGLRGCVLDAGPADVLELAMLGHGRSSISLRRPKGTIYVT